MGLTAIFYIERKLDVLGERKKNLNSTFILSSNLTHCKQKLSSQSVQCKHRNEIVYHNN